MSLYYILIVFCVIALAFWLVYRYAPEPPKTVLLWIISIALVIWILQVLGAFTWLAGVRV